LKREERDVFVDIVAVEMATFSLIASYKHRAHGKQYAKGTEKERNKNT
jgi:hypothetical protein